MIIFTPIFFYFNLAAVWHGGLCKCGVLPPELELPQCRNTSFVWKRQKISNKYIPTQTARVSKWWFGYLQGPSLHHAWNLAPWNRKDTMCLQAVRVADSPNTNRQSWRLSSQSCKKSGVNKIGFLFHTFRLKKWLLVRITSRHIL
jgi:hypothetical protein